MPPVRDASTKPSAATVLPAPVACSNQKRLAALGSSAASAIVLVADPTSRPGPRRRPRPRAAPRAAPPRPAGPRGRARPARPADGAVAAAVAVALRLGQQRGQRAGERVDLVGREDGAVDERGLVLREQAVEAQQQRVAAAPAGRGHRGALVELGQGGVERSPPRGTGRERARRVLAFEQERFTGERRRPLEIVGRWKGCDREGRCLRLSHEGSTDPRRGESRGPPHDSEQPGPQWGRRRLDACPGSNPYSSRVLRRPRPICHRMSQCDGLPPSSGVSRSSPCWSSG